MTPYQQCPGRSHWGIPNRDRDLWNSDDERWIKTNPIRFADDTNTLATATGSATVGGVNAYRPTMRLLRQVRHTHLGDERPGGLFTEVAAYYVWKDGLVAGTSWAGLLASTLEQVAQCFDESAKTGLPDPALGTPMKPALESWRWTSAAQTFSRLAEQAREAFHTDRCAAAKIWRDILGINDRGQVLPLPDGCTAAGLAVGSITAVSAVGSNQPRGFAGLRTPIDRQR